MIEDVLGALLFYFIFAVATVLIAIVIWKANRRNGVLDDGYEIVDQLNCRLKQSFYRFIILVSVFPIFILANAEAATIVTAHPGWTIPLWIFLVVAAIVSCVWLAVIPSYRLIVAFLWLLAGEVNYFVKDYSPLDYYRSKPGDRNAERRRN
jgi:hypothetical protein